MSRNPIIIGAGPAGLTAAYQAVKNGDHPIVFEASDSVGGISRTVECQGFRIDIGGHRFYTKEPLVEALWEEVMGDKMLEVPRLSRIFYKGKFYQYPLEPAETFWNLGPHESLRMALSYMRRRVQPIREEECLADWVTNRFGGRLFHTFFRTYTEKVWGISCWEIRADWAAQRIRNMTLWSALVDAFTRRSEEKSLIRKFKYPERGPGQMWECFRERIEEAGGEVCFNTRAEHIHHENGRVISIDFKGPNGLENHQAQQYISSMPLRTLIQSLHPAPPLHVSEAALSLRYRDFLIVCLFVDCADLFPDNWIYIHSPEVKVGRIQNFKNWSPKMVPSPNVSGLGMEYFCQESDGLWDMEDEQLIELATAEGSSLGLIHGEDVFGGTVVRQPKAYPVYDVDYRKHLDVVREFIADFSNLQTVGRNGMHRYNNQDHSMLTGYLAAENLADPEHDLWDVNLERSYAEDFARKSKPRVSTSSRTSPPQPPLSRSA